ncbi:MAG TPA: hypothetical protein DCX32_02725 [Candidatus Moranbacteria bacterium]|nr:hypothetical protein [Candidatus Moranbacteria bacterium]
MLNPTEEIRLEKKWQRRYGYLRFSVYMLFFLTGLYVSHKILFPSASFDFFFQTPNATKNSIIDPRVPGEGHYENGDVPSGEKLAFDTSLVGDFSQVSVDFDLEGKSPNQLGGTIKVRKSYQAFFYPISKPIGFKNGSLLKNGSDYFMVSDGAIRRFSSTETLEGLGFKKEVFLEVPLSDLALQPRGTEISSSSRYPADSLFRVLDEYYQLKNDSLVRFVSEKAYLTQYPAAQAIEKNISFLNDYPVSEDYLGFSDGTLLAADISVYVVSGKNIYPINNPVTFESMGYLWSDVITANSEEVGIYEEQKLFTISSPHPEGTIFYARDNGKYYYIQNGTRREILSSAILSTYPRKNFIQVEEKSLTTEVLCDIKPRLKILGLYRCGAAIDQIKNLPGNDYQFLATTVEPVKIETLNVNFSQVLTRENMMRSLASLKNRVTNNYIAQ